MEQELKVERTGQYACTVNADGCLSRKNFTVRTGLEEALFEVAALPNPAINGHFWVNVAMDEEQEVLIVISDAQGRWLQQRQLIGGDYYSSEFSVDGAGLYLISVTGKATSRTLKVIVP